MEEGPMTTFGKIVVGLVGIAFWGAVYGWGVAHEWSIGAAIPFGACIALSGDYLFQGLREWWNERRAWFHPYRPTPHEVGPRDVPCRLVDEYGEVVEVKSFWHWVEAKRTGNSRHAGMNGAYEDPEGNDFAPYEFC